MGRRLLTGHFRRSDGRLRAMNITPTPLEGLLVIEPRCFRDERGFFLESFQSERYRKAGMPDQFVQDNQSRSAKGVLRGLHFQVRRPQAQIVTVMRGCVFDVAVDLRPASPTFGQWFGTELSDSGPRQMCMAPGFAHGFCVLSGWADLHYKVGRAYDPNDEGGLLWSDPDVGIQWPIKTPQVAPRDAAFPRIRDLSQAQLPHHPPVEQ
jgi:dTDP-4-dehydrorhamnose 3,5-epimerase